MVHPSERDWDDVLRAAARLQRIVPDACRVLEVRTLDRLAEGGP